MITDEQKEKWVAALRSGDYKQGQDTLSSKDFDGNKSYCCLGVLAEELNMFSGTNSWGYKYIKNEGFEEYSFLPFSVIPEDTQDVLAEMNDSGNADFDCIAKYIEDNL